MKPIKFKFMNAIYAKDQKEYLDLPAFKDEAGRVTSCWKLTFLERLYIFFTGKIFWQQLTFNSPLQPQLPALSFEKLYIIEKKLIGSALGIFHYYRNKNDITIKITWFGISFKISPFKNFKFLPMRKFSQWSHNIRFKIQRKYTRKEFNKIQDKRGQTK